jgi:N-acetylmuramic acid 6-phosphate etherase
MNHPSDLLIGIDGGGSKTLALLADAHGAILGRGYGGCANYQSVGFPAAAQALSDAIAAAFADAGVPVQPVAALCMGIAGSDRPEDQVLYMDWAATAWPGVPVSVVNDAQLVLAAGTPEGAGVALIAGTGSIVYGQAPDGRLARAGGWGHVMGDEGSGYAVGQAALQAVMRAFDGRERSTGLTEAVLRYWGLGAPSDLVGQVYRTGMGPAEVASLAPLVHAAAEQGDAVALDILAEAGRELALAVTAVIEQLRIAGAVACGLAGGLIVNGPLLRVAFLDSSAALGLHLQPITLVTEPAQGAVRLAERMLGKK